MNLGHSCPGTRCKTIYLRRREAVHRTGRTIHRGKHEAQRVRMNKLGASLGQRFDLLTLIAVNAVDATDGIVQLVTRVASYQTFVGLITS